jgi:hypothetical protein
MVEKKDKTRIYLDQNAFSHIARAKGDWRENPYAQVLKKHEAIAEVWVSPTHVVELTLCPDSSLRKRLAEIMLALSSGRRMMGDYGALVVAGFLAYVESRCAGSISSRSYVEYYDETLKQVFLGALALMAMGHEPNPSVIERVTRLKVESRWLRAEAGKDPHSWVAAVKECASELRLTAGPARPELSAKTLEALVTEIHDFEQQAQRIDKKDRIAVDKERALFVRAYAVGDVFDALASTFCQLPGDLLLTFNFSLLANNWTDMSTKLKCRPLPKDPTPDNLDLWMLEELVRSLWKHENGGVSVARLAQEALLRDYVDRLNESEKDRDERIRKEGESLPTDSLTFDADHAGLALGNVHVFVTRDQVLLNSCKTIAKAWTEPLKWQCESVFSPEQLDKSIMRITR